MEGPPKLKEEFQGFENLRRKFGTLSPEAEKDTRPRAARYALSLDPVSNKPDLKAIAYALNKKGEDFTLFTMTVDPSYSKRVEELFEAVLSAQDESEKIAAAETLVTSMQEMQDAS